MYAFIRRMSASMSACLTKAVWPTQTQTSKIDIRAHRAHHDASVSMSCLHQQHVAMERSRPHLRKRGGSIFGRAYASKDGRATRRSLRRSRSSAR